jgi:hypothetical protein
MTAFYGDVFLLGRCGDVVVWDPFSGDAHDLPLDDVPVEPTEIAVSEDRIAILSDRGQTITVYDRAGRRHAKHRYQGESFFTRISVAQDRLLASSFFDDHLLYFYRADNAPPVALVENPRYWPSRSPRYNSFTEVHSCDGQLCAFDLVDFVLYMIDPGSGQVTAFPKNPHPWARRIQRPKDGWNDEGSKYTGTLLAPTATVADQCVYVLMIDRTLQQGSAHPADGFLELAVANINDREWNTVVRLTDPVRFGGSAHLTVIGDTALLLKPEGPVYAISLPD